MKCPSCGKEMIFVREPTKNEVENYVFAHNKVLSAKDALNPKVIESFNFKDDKQVYAYFKAVYDIKCEGDFLEYQCRRDMAESLSKDLKRKITINDYYMDDLGIYIHDC